MSVLKLPKDVVADPRHDAVVQLLAANTVLLWENGRNRVATLSLTKELVSELRRALAQGHASQGLEFITEKLAAEQKGLDALSKKAPESPQNARISRILFLANDGSTRYYRDADSLITRYSQRVLAVRLDVAGDAFGKAILGTEKMVRSVLVFDKTAGARALLALLSTDGEGG